MLEDAMGFADLTEKEANTPSRRIDEAAWGFEFSQTFDLCKGIQFRLGRAGHILGSCWVQFDIPGQGRVVFSGDSGNRDTPILCDPDIPDGCDLLVLESTYGDRLHGDRKCRSYGTGREKVRLALERSYGTGREKVRLALEEENIEARSVWKPMHMQPVFDRSEPKAVSREQKNNRKSYPCRVVGGEVAEDLFERGLCLPSGTAMTEADLERVVETVLNSRKKAQKAQKML
jgi:hypothetical protein